MSEGENQAFTFASAESYEITSVIVDGEDWGNVTSFTFEEVTTIHSLEVVFSAVESDTEDSTDTEDNIEPEDNADTEDNTDSDDNTNTEDSVDNLEDDADTEDSVAVETGDITNIQIWGAMMSIGLLVAINTDGSITKPLPVSNATLYIGKVLCYNVFRIF